MKIIVDIHCVIPTTLENTRLDYYIKKVKTSVW